MDQAHTLECPTCGQPCSREIPEHLSEGAAEIRAMFRDRGAHITPMQAKLLHILRGKNRPIAYGTILESIHGFKPSGDYPQDEILKVAASGARKAIKKAGLKWKITCTWGFGYELEEGQASKTMRRVALSLFFALVASQAVLGWLA